MTKKLTLLLLLSVLFVGVNVSLLYAQQQTSVSGSVKDAITGDPLAGATIIVKGRVLGTTTDSNGEFFFSLTIPPPFTLIFSSVEYEIKEYEVTTFNEDLNIQLRPQTSLDPGLGIGLGNAIPILQSPVAISKLSEAEFRNAAAFNFYDAIANISGIQMNTSSLLFQSLNTRGFANIGNTRLVQAIDGVDNAPPGLNFAVGNFVGTSELDVAEIELISGPASALYGPNTFNGILFLHTKNPFDYTGLSAYAKNGLTNQKAGGTHPFVEVGVRYGAVFNDNLAFKINLSGFKGTDWFATDELDIDINPLNPDKGSLSTNPSYDGVNIYGDEIATTIDLDAIAGMPTGTFGNIHVARTGYREPDLTNYDVENLKADAAIYYRLNEEIELIGSYRYGFGTTFYQGTNRFALQNLSMHQVRAEAKADNFFVRGYAATENSGDSYDMRFAAWNINRLWKSDQQWFQDYALSYLGEIPDVPSLDHQMARAFADRNRLEPGTAAFQLALDSITALTNPTQGAKFLDRSQLYHIEGQYLFDNLVNALQVQIGGNYRMYRLISEGTLFSDLNNPISVAEFGIYAQATMPLMKDRLKLSGAIRYDKNQNFDGQINPRASIIFSAGRNKAHNFRISYQNGFRNPSVQDQFLTLDVGVARLLGGTQQNVSNFSTEISYLDNNGTPQTAMVTGTDVYTNSFTASSVNTFIQTEDATVLQRADIGFLKPEKVATYEVGYRGIFGKNIFMDIHYYYNAYEDFIASTSVVHPLTGTIGELNAVEDLVASRSEVFRLYSNATSTVTAQGIGANIEYTLGNGFRLSTTYNHASFDTRDANPDLLPGFNTPAHRFSIGLGNTDLGRGFGFMVRYRWSEGYFWEDSFGSGWVEQYDVLNAQITHKIRNSKVRLKIGGNNILNREYQTAFGTPNIGSVYYVSILFDELFDY